MVKVKWYSLPNQPGKVIGSLRYKKRCETNSKPTAKEIARGLRSNGYLARISKQPKNEKYPWAIYYREKKKWRKK